jgi:hypothetical protein
LAGRQDKDMRRVRQPEDDLDPTDETSGSP